MLKFIAKSLFGFWGWTLNPDLPDEMNRCVMIAVPHTSNWDFLYMRVGFFLLGVPLKFTIKDSWMKFPLNLFMGPMGGIGVNRKPKAPGEERPSITEVMTNIFKERDRIAMMITPEGSRSKREHWKMGFYHTAKAANVPIVCGYLDYEKKEGGLGLVLHPSDDMDADLRKIMAFYKNIPGKRPENFSPDIRYDDENNTPTYPKD